MRRHLPWLIPLVSIPVVYLVIGLIVAAIAGTAGFDESLGLGLLNIGLLLVGFAAIVVAIVLTIRNARRVFRAWRNRNGHYSKPEAAVLHSHLQSRQGWAEAQRLRGALLRREVPTTITVWDIVPNSGEVFFYDVDADYERYYGQDVTYSTGGGLFIGHPAFVLAGVVGSAIGNAARRNAAAAQAAEQWRERGHVRLIISNRRLICLVRGQWLSFYYDAVTAVYPEVNQWTLVCQFGGGVAPLRLQGVNAPLAALLTIFGTHGLDAVGAHPSLQALGGGGTDRGTGAGGTGHGGAGPGPGGAATSGGPALDQDAGPFA
ncbi:hypothetical protein ACPEEZ_12575 [Frigoribacterium sp. 2-23]|uniref:hypothetical protein n=1 Tax=Frigoribacterium sp. 2-23 TaxID=3415006 RepID=UPI003C6F5428